MYFLSQKISIFVSRGNCFSIQDFLAAICTMTAKGALALLLAVLIMLPPFRVNPLPSFASEYVQNNLVTNGTVYDIEVANGKVYLAGSFTQVGSNVGSGVFLDLTTGNLASKFPKVDKKIRAVIPDDSGGWYIGGDFTLVGGLRRNKIAHILSDGSVDPNWDPNIIFENQSLYPRWEIEREIYSGTVFVLAISSSTLYVGGGFSKIGDKHRNNLAAIDTRTGEVKDWHPNVNGYVKTLVINGSTLYIGGAFNKIGNESRNNLGAVDISTGKVTNWDVGLKYAIVNALALNGSTLYVGGDSFVANDNQIRYGLIAIDLTTGDLIGEKPNFSYGSEVKSLTINSSTLYVGGKLWQIDGQNRNNLAAIDLVTGKLTSFNPNVAGSVDALAIDGSTLYVGGGFTKVGKESRNNLAAIDLTTEVVTGWNPNVGRSVYAIAVNNSSLYAGGEVTTVGGQLRSDLAVIDTNTGELINWKPNIEGYISGFITALEANSTTLFIGGYFSMLGDLYYRNGLAAIDLNTGNITSWNPQVELLGSSAYIKDITINNSTLYVGGSFTSINGLSRHGIAAFDIITGNLTNLRQDVNGEVLALEVDGSNLYIGGGFDKVGGQPRNNLAAIDITSGEITSWNPKTITTTATGAVLHLSYIRSLVVKDSVIYTGGRNTSKSWQKTLAAFDLSTGDVINVTPDVWGSVNTLALGEQTLYLGGLFTAVDKQARIQLAAIDTTTGKATSWNPDVGGYIPINFDIWAPQLSNVKTLVASDSALYVGGNFTSIGSEVISNFAKLSPSRSTSFTSGGSTSSTKEGTKTTSNSSTSTSNETTSTTETTTSTSGTTTSTSESTTTSTSETTTSTTGTTTSTIEGTTSTSGSTTTTTDTTTSTDTTKGNGRPEEGRPEGTGRPEDAGRPPELGTLGSNGNTFGKNK